MPLLTALSWSHGVSRLLSHRTQHAAIVAGAQDPSKVNGNKSARRRATGARRFWPCSIVVSGLVIALMASGCGPFGYISKVSSKSVDAVEKAEQAQAETYAPYEYWAARAYLERARVMMSYSEYERAFDYGSRAQQLAEAATRKAERVKQEEAQKASAKAAQTQGDTQ